MPEIIHLEKMPWSLHIDPERLLVEVRRKVVKMQSKVDAIVLGYGRCQTLDRLGEDFEVPVLRPEGKDCIGVLLGQRCYEEELQNEGGTWFLSPGWIRMGIEFIFQELQINRIGPTDIDPLQAARRMLKGYTRAVYIDMFPDIDEDDLPNRAQKIAADLGLRLEKTKGSLASLEEAFCISWNGLNRTQTH